MKTGGRYSNSRPFFSIGVTTYDRVSMLVETLSSILTQTFEDFEVIVGNDNPDRIISGEVLGIDDTRIRFVNYAENLGELGNMNSLLNISRGKYFTWLADDDLYTPDFLRRIYETLVTFDFPLCAFTSYMVIGPNYSGKSQECPVGGSQLLTGRQFLRKYLEHSVRVIGCYGVFDSQYLRKTGGIEQLGNGFSPYSDNLLVIKAGLLEKVVYINAPLIFYRTHEGSISLVSTDVDAYSTAQADLLSKSVNVFRSHVLNEDFKFNLFLLLKWCMEDYFAVMRRSGKLQWQKLLSYLVFLVGYIKVLQNYRYQIMVMAIVICNMYKLIKYFTFEKIRSILNVKQ